MTTRENAKATAAKQGIVQLILKWKLNSADVQLQKDAALLSEDTRKELTQLLDQYRSYDKIMFSVSENIDRNPETARMMMNRIPSDILITHPSYRKLSGKFRKDDDDKRLRTALKHCADAERLIHTEFNQGKAEDALESAKQMLPQWTDIPELRTRIETLTEENEKLGEALSIQREISALRETGGQSAYQQALTLLNRYQTLGIEDYGIKLFDVDEERDQLLRMMVRADGSSWTYRLSPSASQEIIRLEQSIRSLEDAENKNLRVLINNNSRLLTVLIGELEQMDPDSEQAIQASARINELRQRNQQLQSDILTEVATRAEEYCQMAEQALSTGEISAAQANIRMAADTGKPASLGGEDDYLGEVSLPTSVTDKIRELEARVARAQQTRTQVRKEVDSIRRQFYNEDDLTLNKLFSWKTSLDNSLRNDPFAPGLKQLHQEIGERYAASLNYLMEKTAYDIESDLRKGDAQAASARLDAVTPYFSTDEQKEFISRQLYQIKAAENLRNRSASLNDELRTIYNHAAANMSCSDADLKSARKLLQSIEALYADENTQQPQDVAMANERILARLQLLHDNSDRFSAFKSAAAGGPTDAAVQAAEQLEASALYEFPQVRSSLALFWRDAGLSDKTTDESTNLYFARAARIAQESADAALQSEIAQTIAAYNDRNDHGRQLNLLLESLRQFYNEKSFAAGVDFINNKIDPSLKADPQIQLWADKIEQAFRMEQADRLLNEARASFAADDLLKAEELATQSLDFFYSVEGAQLQKSIVSKREDEERDVRELQSFLDVDLGTNPTLDEKTSAQIRYIRERLKTLDKKNIRDLKLLGDISALDQLVEQLADQESADFSQMRNVFASKLVAGPESLSDAGNVLREIENRSWITNIRPDLIQMKAEKGSIERIYASLKAIVDQAQGFAKEGDFRSAKRILSSFTGENLSEYPGWISVMKQSAEDEIDRMAQRYAEVQTLFDPNRENMNNIISRIDGVFENNIPDMEVIFQLQTDLQRQRMILEKELKVDMDTNPYIAAISYLEEVLHWAETIAEFDFGIEFPQEVFSVEPLYQLRRIGKNLYESIPPLLIEIQPVLARENKWLERRTRVRQALQQINECYSAPGKIRSSRFHDIETEIDNLTMVALLEQEKTAFDETVDIMKKTRRGRTLLLAVVISIVIILALLYYFLPQIADMLGIGR